MGIQVGQTVAAVEHPIVTVTNADKDTSLALHQPIRGQAGAFQCLPTGLQ